MTGSVPADALQRITLLGSGQPDPLVPISKLDLEVTGGVAHAIHRALSINSNDRFSNLEEFWSAIGKQPGWKPLDTAVVALSSPSTQPIPSQTGNYNGTIDDTTANIITGMGLAIQQQAGHGAISGYFTVNTPLLGSGKFAGSLNASSYIQFVVQAYKTNSPLYFWGWLKSNGILNGDYCSLNTQNQCNPNAGASGPGVSLLLLIRSFPLLIDKSLISVLAEIRLHFHFSYILLY